MVAPHAPAHLRDVLRDELRAAWSRSDDLFDRLTEDALQARPIALRQPLLFYLGHLPAFAWNQVARGVLGRGAFDAELDARFARGIDPPDEDAAPPAEAWPAPARVRAYRDGVRAALLDAVDTLVDRAATDLAGDPLAVGGRIVHLVVEHERMHHETLLYLFQELPAGALSREGLPALVTGPDVPAGDVRIPAGPIVLGARFEDVPFAWDNELPEERVDVPAFRLDRLPVTVARFRAFVEAGGYDDPRWWAPEDRPWARRRGHPKDWARRGDAWAMRTLLGEVPLDDVGGWPVLASHAEASAYARWAGARLPTEAELHRAARGTPEGVERRYPWGDERPRPAHGNFDLRAWAPVPVGSHPAGRSAWGVEELVGNGWEWTDTPFAPRPGFTPWIRTYPGYSADFFDGDHRVVYGAAWPTDARFLRPSFRNWYRRRYPYAFATFRCARAG